MNIAAHHEPVITRSAIPRVLVALDLYTELIKPGCASQANVGYRLAHTTRASSLAIPSAGRTSSGTRTSRPAFWAMSDLAVSGST